MKSTVEWFAATRKKPKCDKKADSFGVKVLVWPPQDVQDGTDGVRVAFFGRRVTVQPSFYIYGRVINPQLWAYLPEPPVSAK